MNNSVNRKCLLILDDGSTFLGDGFGYNSDYFGEICFNTSITGYQEILTILQNMVKQRKESVSIYSKAGRQDLKKREEKEIEIINSFLPTQIKSNDLEKIIEETIKELDCQSLKDLGKVISNLKEKYPAQMDMREVADLAKKKLK